MRILLFLLAFSCCFADEQLTEVPDVSSTEGLPSSLINGMVCAISGEYTESCTDMTIAGVEPLTIGRNYSNISNSFWSLNHTSCLITGLIGESYNRDFIIRVRQENGSYLDFSHSYSSRKKEMFCSLRDPKGLTNGNCAGGRYNLKNMSAHYNYKRNEITVSNGARDKKIFKMAPTNKDIHKVDRLKKANGSVIRYFPNKEIIYGLSGIECSAGGQFISHVHIMSNDPKEGVRVVHFKGTDGNELTYFWNKCRVSLAQKGSTKEISFHTRFYIDRVESSSAPTIEYSYVFDQEMNGLQVSEKRWPNNRFVKIKYFKSKHEYLSNRVRSLRAPVGLNSDSILTHRFIYEKFGKDKGGRTSVYDAYNHCQRFVYNQENRLKKHILYRGENNGNIYFGEPDHKIYSTELYKWGHGDNKGNLAGKILLDNKRRVHHAQYFSYDDAGNIKKKKLCGPLTGLPCGAMHLKPSLSLARDNYEQEVKRCRYSDDGRNLLLSETNSEQVVTIFEYGKKTDRIKAKFVSYDNRIRTREFYDYDQTGALCRKIVDDGFNKGRDDLCYVTQRLITHIVNRTTAPVGYPERITQTCFNFATGKEDLISSQVLHYNPKGHLLSQEHYDANNELSHVLTWEYDNFGNVIREVNALGHEIIRKFDENNNLIFEQGPSFEFYTENTYDYSNRLIRKEEIHDDGQRFTSHYKYNYLSQCISTTNAYGQEIKQTYDEFGRVIKEEYPALVDAAGELKTPIIKRKYNCAGHPILVRDELGRETRTRFNIRGQPLEISYPNGTREKFIYRIDGQLIEKTDVTGIITRYQRDPIGRVIHEGIYSQGTLLKEKHYTYNSIQLTSSTDEAGLITYYFYDAAGRLENLVVGEKRQNLKYDSLGRVCEKKEWFGSEPHEYQLTVTQYDKLNRVVEEKIISEDKILRFNKYAYDVRGNKIFSQSGDEITLTEYNTQNQPTKITNPAGEVTYTSYNFQFVDTYGRQVLQTITTDPLGYQTIDTYDPANRLVEVDRKNPFGLLVSKQTTYFDLCGNLTRVQNHKVEEGKVQDTIESCLEYTLDNQVCLYIQANGRPEQKISRFTYNSVGQRTEWIKNDGALFYYTYDSLGRLQNLLSSDGTIHYDYTYDIKDQVIKVEDVNSGQITERAYDLYGNLLSEKLAHGLALSYTYDRLERPRTIQFPDQTGIEYIYDGCNLTHTHRMIKGKRAYTHQNLKHTLNGQPAAALLPGGIQVNYSYDTFGRCTKIDSPHYRQEIPENGYDPAGNLVLCQTQEETYEYKYDDLYQLIREKDHEYQFDSINNRIKKDGEIAIYNGLHQLVQKGTDPLLYDRNGNLIQRVENGEIIQYTYDALDRLISVNQNGQVTTYTYDPFNRRLTRKNKEEVKFIYQNQDEIGLWQEETIKELRIIDNRKATLAIELEKTLYLPIQDIIGNIVCLQDAKGELVEQYRYTAFGETTILDPQNQVIEESVVRNPWQYSNKRRDQESDLYSFGLRYYDAKLGRWLTPDPEGTIDGPNLYAYVHNNPLIFQDEYGLYGMPSMNFPSFRTAKPEPYKDPVVTFQPMETKFTNDFYKYSDRFGRGQPVKPLEQAAIYDTNSIKATLDSKELPKLYEVPIANHMAAFGNGILTPYRTFARNTMYLSDICDSNFFGVHSPTFGFRRDLQRYFAGLHYGIGTETVEKIKELWQNYFDKNPNGQIFWVCHSRGALDTRNALINFPKELRERITVLAVAPAAYIDDHLCEKVVHLVSTRDIVPCVDFNGRMRCRHTTKVLKPHPKAPLFDHDFTSPTYRKEIKKQYENFLEKHRT